MVSALLGDRAKDEILSEIRRETGKPIPHIVGIARDGQRYGWDSNAGRRLLSRLLSYRTARQGEKHTYELDRSDQIDSNGRPAGLRALLCSVQRTRTLPSSGVFPAA